MKLKKVAELNPTARFLYWVKERHKIYEARENGLPKPWTNDEVLQNYFFTNPYRENDKTTRWFRERIRFPLRERPEVVFATICFRWFNLVSTGEELVKRNLLLKWNRGRAVKYLGKLREQGKNLFTGAFMIHSPPGKRKLEAICERLQEVWKDRIRFTVQLENCNSLRQAHSYLLRIPGIGNFMSYEIVCDLRYTYLLENANDTMTWCSPGPGCARGLYRVAGKEPPTGGKNSDAPRLPKDWKNTMQQLLTLMRKRLDTLPPFEMREVEHSLCEFDKYERARLKDGCMKRRYNGT